MSITIREMTLAAYDEVLALWQTTEGIGLSNTDSKENMGRFLERNPGLSFLAEQDGDMVGTVLCGHDGRRGYIHHLAVKESHRHQGIGKVLVGRCLSALKEANIDKCHLFVFVDNLQAIDFWKHTGWTQRGDLTVMSHYTVDSEG